MTKVRGVREGHWDVEGGHSESGDKVAAEVGEAVLWDPLEEGNIVR